MAELNSMLLHLSLDFVVAYPDATQRFQFCQKLLVNRQPTTSNSKKKVCKLDYRLMNTSSSLLDNASYLLFVM